MGRNMSAKEKYGKLPSLTESVARELLDEVSTFAEAMRYDPKNAAKEVEDDIRWLTENKGFLGRAVEAAVDAALETVEEELSHKTWVELRTLLLTKAYYWCYKDLTR